MTNEEMPRMQKAILHTLCTVESLIDKGLVEGQKTVSEKGWEEVEKLKQEGFSPTEDELHSAMKAIRAI